MGYIVATLSQKKLCWSLLSIIWKIRSVKNIWGHFTHSLTVTITITVQIIEIYLLYKKDKI